MTRSLLVLSVLFVLAGCSQPEVVPSPTPDEELGSAPTVTELEPSPVAAPTPEGAPGTPAASAATPTVTPSTTADEPSDAPSAPGDATAAPPAQQETATVEPRVLLAVTDAQGDQGRQGPAWVDLRAVELLEVGNDLRVTLRFDGAVPSQPPAGEVPLLGVNIGDEGYQLFVEGGGEAWAAYLDTPEGFVPYPGTFELAGGAMVLQVPFNAVGSPTRAPVSVFVEWSQDSGLVGALNPTSEDRLDGEPHTFDRAP